MIGLIIIKRPLKINLTTPIVIVKECDVMRYALSPKCVLGSIKGKLIKYMHVKIETKR